MDLLLYRAGHVCGVEEVLPGKFLRCYVEMVVHSSNFTCGSASSVKVPSTDLG
jgi:hypothetical protein